MTQFSSRTGKERHRAKEDKWKGEKKGVRQSRDGVWRVVGDFLM